MEGKDADGSAVNGVIAEEGLFSALDITAAVLLKAGAPGRLMRVSVIVAGSAAGTVNDVATTGAAGTANQFGTIPATVGTYIFNWPCFVGMVVVPGSGQTLAASYV